MEIRGKPLSIIMALVILSIIALLAKHITVGTEQAEVEDAMEDQRMRQLIERLEYAYRPPIRFGGEPIIYWPKKDETIRDEILSEDKDIIPYLIDGLYHDSNNIKEESAALLGRIPCVKSMEGLIKYLENVRGSAEDNTVFLSLVQRALYRITGYGEIFPPKVNGNALEGMCQYWIPWWEAHKDKLEDTETGIILRHENGSIIPLPLKRE